MDAMIEELKRLHAEATQGEWLDAGSGSPFWVQLAGDEHGAGWRKNRDNDAAWVAAIHNAFPAIAAQLEAAQLLRDAVAAWTRNNYGTTLDDALEAYDKAAKAK